MTRFQFTPVEDLCLFGRITGCFTVPKAGGHSIKHITEKVVNAATQKNTIITLKTLLANSCVTSSKMCVFI